MTSTWEQRAADKRARIDQSIPAEWKIPKLPTEDSVIGFPAESGILSAKELTITELSASDLVRQLAHGELKAVDVTVAFCKRAALAQQLVCKVSVDSTNTFADLLQVNCCHEFFPEAAIAQAKELDEYLETHGKPVGPLHGLPISLKDQLRVKVLNNSPRGVNK